MPEITETATPSDTSTLDPSAETKRSIILFPSSLFLFEELKAFTFTLVDLLNDEESPEPDSTAMPYWAEILSNCHTLMAKLEDLKEHENFPDDAILELAVIPTDEGHWHLIQIVFKEDPKNPDILWSNFEGEAFPDLTLSLEKGLTTMDMPFISLYEAIDRAQTYLLSQGITLPFDDDLIYFAGANGKTFVQAEVPEGMVAQVTFYDPAEDPFDEEDDDDEGDDPEIYLQDGAFLLTEHPDGDIFSLKVPADAVIDVTISHPDTTEAECFTVLARGELRDEAEIRMDTSTVTTPLDQDLEEH